MRAVRCDVVSVSGRWWVVSEDYGPEHRCIESERVNGRCAACAGEIERLTHAHAVAVDHLRDATERAEHHEHAAVYSAKLLRRERDVVADAVAKVERLTRERDEGRANSESWRRVCNAWQDWATELLHDYGRQPLYGEHGDGPAREIIAQLVGMVPGVPRCSRCGCFATEHEVDDEERRECTRCECTQFEAA